MADMKDFLEPGFEEIQRDFKLADSAREQAGWPPYLRKAVVDPFEYAALITGLGIVRFSSVGDCGGGWVRIVFDGGMVCVEDNPIPLPFRFERGIEVRLEDIRWVADAPDGS